MAAQFEECREKITEMPGIIKDLCRVLYHRVCYNNEKHLTSRFHVAVRLLSNRSQITSKCGKRGVNKQVAHELFVKCANDDTF